jgi:zinc metalloprotease ZmpB
MREDKQMLEEFDRSSGTKVIRDSKGVARGLSHEQGVVSRARTARLAAQEYLCSFRGLLGAKTGEFENLSLPPERDPVDAGVEFRFLAEKSQFDTTTVSYYQTFFGLPVWEAGLSVHMKQAPFRIMGARSTGHPDIQVAKPSAQALARLKKLNAQTLAKVLGIADKPSEFNAKSLRVLHQRLMIYRYEESQRVVVPEQPIGKGGKRLVSDDPMLPLPPVARGIAEGRHYVVAVVDFRVRSRRFGVIPWVALLEAETLTVLYLRALIDDVSGLVFPADPMTLNAGPPPTAANRALNSLRSPVTLQGLNRPNRARNLSLSGKIIKIRNFSPPRINPPTQRRGVAFNYKARTNDFAAVNAYYHCDRFFRLVEDLGFPRASYFNATTFPLPVDHRGSIGTTDGSGNEVNAKTEGKSTSTGGLENVRFALADVNNTVDPIGIACDWRVVLHELGGHATLWNHINWGKFKFAHSAGDGFAAILNDPETQLTGNTRFDTFPWSSLPKKRSHGRKVRGGWAWGGEKDLGVERDPADPNGYQSEQILSTTHFRIYRSIGGDAAELNMRRFAARFVAYLILRTIGDMGPADRGIDADQYAKALMDADGGDWTHAGHAGGAYAKVIRWAFEKQGLYQPPGAPTPVTKPGVPEPVDVYIEDGRKGEYQYQSHYWSCRAIWNRHANDGRRTHQEPVAGTTNFAYVKVKNRGTQTATGVTVKAFHCKPSAGGVYPDDWQPMTTAQVPAPDVAPNSAAEITVGPFAWVPSQAGDESMIMVVSAPGDLSNIGKLTPGESIPAWRLVPHDNNIGLRNVFPVDGTGPRGLRAAFDGRRISVKNPHAERARMVIKPVLPPLLAKRNWRLEFINRGGRAFSLKARTGRDVVMRLKPGRKFTAKQVKSARNPTIHVEVYANDILVGGASYPLDPARHA